VFTRAGIWVFFYTVRRRRRWVQTRGLNRNHNPVVKDVFKSAATTAATRAGALQDWYN